MMKQIRIVADSTCDLSQELIEKYQISIIPLCIMLGEDTYLDGVDITPEEIYKWSDEHKTTPKTSAIPFGNESLLHTQGVVLLISGST